MTIEGDDIELVPGFMVASGRVTKPLPSHRPEGFGWPVCGRRARLGPILDHRDRSDRRRGRSGYQPGRRGRARSFGSSRPSSAASPATWACTSPGAEQAMLAGTRTAAMIVAVR